jgi:hypothetical protein
MDSAAAVTSVEAAPAPIEASTGPTPLELAALRQPALVPSPTGWLSTAPRLWLEWATQLAREALEFTLDRPVSIDVLRADPGNAREAVFAIDFDHPSLEGGGSLTLDLPAARLVVDALETDFANVRGSGALSEAELGVLEYAALAVVDRAIRAAAGSHELVIRAFHDARALRSPAESPNAPAATTLALRLRIAGREGIARLHVNGWASQALTPPPAATPPARAAAASAPIDVRLALPPVRIERSDFQSLQAGDVLLLGVSDLASFGTPCRLATPNGWSLSTATIVRDSPTVVSVRCGPFALQPLPAAVPGEPQAMLNLLVGSQPLSPEQLQRWQPEASIDLAKDPALPVDVYEGLLQISRGELVRLDGEIGVRLAEVRHGK